MRSNETLLALRHSRTGTSGMHGRSFPPSAEDYHQGDTHLFAVLDHKQFARIVKIEFIRLNFCRALQGLKAHTGSRVVLVTTRRTLTLQHADSQEEPEGGVQIPLPG